MACTLWCFLEKSAASYRDILETSPIPSALRRFHKRESHRVLEFAEKSRCQPDENEPSDLTIFARHATKHILLTINIFDIAHLHLIIYRQDIFILTIVYIFHQT